MGSMSAPKSFPPPGELQPDMQPNRNVMANTPPTLQPMPAGVSNPYTTGVTAPPAAPVVASPNSTNTSIAPRPMPNQNTVTRNKINQYSEYL